MWEVRGLPRRSAGYSWPKRGSGAWGETSPGGAGPRPSTALRGRAVANHLDPRGRRWRERPHAPDGPRSRRATSGTGEAGTPMRAVAQAGNLSPRTVRRAGAPATMSTGDVPRRSATPPVGHGDNTTDAAFRHGGLHDLLVRHAVEEQARARTWPPPWRAASRASSAPCPARAGERLYVTATRSHLPEARTGDSTWTPELGVGVFAYSRARANAGAMPAKSGRACALHARLPVVRAARRHHARHGRCASARQDGLRGERAPTPRMPMTTGRDRAPVLS